MGKRYPEYKKPDFTATGEQIRKFWEEGDFFRKTLEMTTGRKPFVFYEGPPSANGIPGIHHVMARAIKDLFCRYKTMKGFHVERKGGWDTHGLPVEISVEKTLGIRKEDIGRKISVAEYNQACRREVMKYKEEWDELTRKMGYWVDLDNPYITFDNKYIETVWHLLKLLFDKGLLYKGYTIQPYSPAAGTGLSTHELNQPGCYRDVKDTTVVAQFRVIRNEASERLFALTDTEVFILAWTTTPWTLPSNTALAVGATLKYSVVKTLNPYSGTPVTVVLASTLLGAWFQAEAKGQPFDAFNPGDKIVPWELVGEFRGSELKGIRYEQLIPFVKPRGDAFRVIEGDFVTTEDGTGVVHIAPTFGADDDRVAKASGIVPLLLTDSEGNQQPMVDRTGRFFRIEDLDAGFVQSNVNREVYAPFAGRFTKNEFDDTIPPGTDTLDVDLAVWLKKNGQAFRIEKYVHNYPHCWRTDKPILYYPLDSWFIKTTALKERMIELNGQINWKPAWTGEGRFGEWLKNLVDWNLSRSRFWGIPLPVWVTEDRSEIRCIGSAEELKQAIEAAVRAGVMTHNPLEKFIAGEMSDQNYQTFDFHRPFVDEIVLVSPSGKKMFREPDLIDVWFDSGAMPYAQYHYPFENKAFFADNYPADFIAEGVDQTRGWFFTLHAIATLAFDSVAYRNVLSNGLVLDRNGNKMSKRLGNAIDPFETIDRFGPDATRWYLITNAQPWDNLKFDLDGVAEVQRKFFGTLFNTYAFFALYANIDGFDYHAPEVPYDQRPEIDRWILSELNSLILNVDEAYGQYEPTRAGRAIQYFVDEHLSNWYVRLSRRRFWKGEMGTDKLSAYQTLYQALITVAKLAAPIAPFYSEQLYRDLNNRTGKEACISVHMASFPVAHDHTIDKKLEARMEWAQKISSMVLSLRKRSNVRVRQPLQRIMIPVPATEDLKELLLVADLVKNEVNIKEIQFTGDDDPMLVKTAKANFKALGPRYGKLMKELSARVLELNRQEISAYEQNGFLSLSVAGNEVQLGEGDLEIITRDIPGWMVATEGTLTVALDFNITGELAMEGIARDFVNRVQTLRKEMGFDVTDRIVINVEKNHTTDAAIAFKYDYICSETLADRIVTSDQGTLPEVYFFEPDEAVKVAMTVARV
ncbi:MAG TPA: isoleucine--tRNA ligase [Bacteroidales bacterium]|nr:isoleucine--tRNA ligase [Bacteroidales bacterium]HRZ47980.1 isoleucine--tRNA ligase [Bacteroidales bacterium]